MKRLFAIVIVLACSLLPAPAQQTASRTRLKYVMIVSRHGVRSPTWTPERLNQYSSSPWPDWKTPPGNLTAHGRTLMKIMGGFYREYLAAEGLLGKSDCSEAGNLYFWADTDQRTLESARALAEGMLPGCKSEIHSMPDGKSDPLFDPIDAGVVKPDGKLSLAAVQGRIGPQLDAVIDAHRSAFDVLEHVLKGSGKAANSIFDQPMSFTVNDTSVTMSGPLNLASTLSEDFLLEYTDGWKNADLGWGRLSALNLRQIMSLHTAYADLMRRTPYLARARGSNLMSHIVRSLEQAVTGRAVKGATGAPEAAVAVISGHDTNISNLSGMLDLTWTLPSYQQDDSPPGGALIFSLWQSTENGRFDVRIQFAAQTLDQMHDATPLSLQNPPAVANVFLPGCSTSQEGFPCSWPMFQRAAQTALDPAFVP